MSFERNIMYIPGNFTEGTVIKFLVCLSLSLSLSLSHEGKLLYKFAEYRIEIVSELDRRHVHVQIDRSVIEHF